MENKLKRMLQLKGTPNDTAIEVFNLAQKALEKNNDIAYLKFLIVLQGKMATHNPPRMKEEDYDKVFQEVLEDLLNEEIA